MLQRCYKRSQRLRQDKQVSRASSRWTPHCAIFVCESAILHFDDNHGRWKAVRMFVFVGRAGLGLTSADNQLRVSAYSRPADKCRGAVSRTTLSSARYRCRSQHVKRSLHCFLSVRCAATDCADWLTDVIGRPFRACRWLQRRRFGCFSRIGVADAQPAHSVWCVQSGVFNAAAALRVLTALCHRRLPTHPHRCGAVRTFRTVAAVTANAPQHAHARVVSYRVVLCCVAVSRSNLGYSPL